MLATMRPAPTTQFSSLASNSHSGNSASTSRPPSRAASVASSTHSSINSPVKLSTSNRSKRNGTRSGLNPKKGSATSAQPQPTDSSTNTPGLISLSRPVESASSSSPRPKKGNRKEANKKQQSAAAEYAEAVSTPADESLLSKSAPQPATTSRKQKKKAAAVAAAANNDNFSADNAPSALTWQQQLLGSGASGSKAKNHKNDIASADTSLTWQQELFNASNKAKRGPHFDVFADARDAETFGSGGEDSGAGSSLGRRRSDSVGKPASRRNAGNKAVKADLALDDVFASGPNQPRRNGNPSTPNKAIRNKHASPAHHLAIPASSNDSNEPAYAGPEFHNSPSAASLPAPKFMSKKHHQGTSSSSSSLRPSSLRQRSSSGDEGEASSSSSEADSSSLEIERQKRNSQRGVTAPPTTNASHGHNANGMNKSATIENLLAQMMGGSGLSMKQ